MEDVCLTLLKRTAVTLTERILDCIESSYSDYNTISAYCELIRGLDVTEQHLKTLLVNEPTE